MLWPLPEGLETEVAIDLGFDCGQHECECGDLAYGLDDALLFAEAAANIHVSSGCGMVRSVVFSTTPRCSVAFLANYRLAVPSGLGAECSTPSVTRTLIPPGCGRCAKPS